MAKAIQERRWHDMRELRDQIEALGEVAVGPLLEVLLRDPDERLQIYAASLLGDLQEKVPQGMLTEALRVYALPVLEGVASSDMPPHLRHGALIALGNVGNSGSVAFLLETLRQAESDILAMSAAHALGRLRDEDIQGTLTALVDRESDPAVRKLLVMALNQRPDPEMKSFLSDLARQDFDTQVRIEAVEGLGALDTPEADHVLREIVRGLGRSEVRTAAIDGLGRPGEEANLPFLKRILRSSDNPGMRNEAYLSIQDIGTPGAKAIIEDYQPGARVEGIIPGTQAEALGLAPDDVITDYDGKPVTGPTDLQILAKETPVDQLVALVVHRDGRSITYAIHGDFIGVNISPGAVID
jgi:HEAT repeat protein